VKEYELYVPLFLNDGTPVLDEVIDSIGERLLDQFGGCTYFRSRIKASGRWEMSSFATRL